MSCQSGHGNLELGEGTDCCTSTVEAEYIAQAHAAREAQWLHSFIGELCGDMQEPLTINCDNQGAIALSKNNKFHSYMKHINIHCHFIHEVIEDWNVSAVYIPSDENPINILTKPL